ncbi:MAG: biosynthetic-type acetolactate synthase large subunit [Deltaproteobacteria bacterium]|nr:biosynthetic-type acetolactate synthase large subunit [Deltaproteobacteria bacterium]
MTKKCGAEILFEVLVDEGVDTIFGYPGGAVIDIYDHMPNYPIKHILTRHEQAAVHAADGYARTSGKTGVCLVTSGPGATNTVSGVASAYLDSIPLVVITGQVPCHLIGNDAFQEVDIVGITRPCTKHNYLVKRVEDLARVIREAFAIAASGRPGPVLIDLPKDVMQHKIPFTMPGPAHLRGYNPNYHPHRGQLQKAVKLMVKAHRPVLFGGGGVILSKASAEFRQLAAHMSLPVTTTLMGLGAFPGTDPLWLGMLGMHGTYPANMSVGECDLLIAVGARFDDRVTGKTDEFAPHAKIIHVDIDPTSIRKNIQVDVPIVGDCKLTLQALNELLAEEDVTESKANRDDWLHQIKTWKEASPLRYRQDDQVIKPQYVVEKLYELTQGKAIITTEVGQNQMWAAQFYHFDKPNTFVTSGGLGCMGFGFPAAIGAQTACPDRVVIDIAGDGSIQMNIQELATAVENKLPVKIAILNNRYLGMVRQWQELFKDRRYVCTNMEGAPDFVLLAEAYGAVGLRATRPDEVEDVIKKALDTPQTVIMDFVVDREECVYPMVAAGDPITKMLLV